MGSVTLLELRMCGEKRKWRGAQSEGLGPPGAVGATEGLQAARVLCRRFSYDLTGCAIPDAFASFHFSPISQLWITPGSVFSLANLIQSHDFKYILFGDISQIPFDSPGFPPELQAACLTSPH